MGNREARLRCMLRKPEENIAHWDLNDEDRNAIQWAFDRIDTLEKDLEITRAHLHKILHESIVIRDKAREASNVLKNVFG